MSDVGAAHDHDHDRDDLTTATDHAPAGGTLGPVDVTAWAYAVCGSVAGLVLAVALLVAGEG
jgi:hypothetical protein